MAFHCAAPNPLRAFLTTLVGILSPTYCHRGCVIWLHPHITVHFPRSPCSRHAGLCSVPQTSSFPPPDLCTGCSGYIKHPTPPAPTQHIFHPSWSNTRFLRFSQKYLLTLFRVLATSCHYIFNCIFTSFILSAENVLSICYMPGRKCSEPRRTYWCQ